MISLIYEAIDLRSFTNLWYWIGLAIIWSANSHYILMIPNDLAIRAKKYGGQDLKDFEALSHIGARRLSLLLGKYGAVLFFFLVFSLTVIVVTGFAYNVEFAQAISFIVVPLSLVLLFLLRFAQKILTEDYTGEALIKAYNKQRVIHQFIGMVSIFVTAMWGITSNIMTGLL